MKLSDIVDAYIELLPYGIILDEDRIMRNLREAVRFYCGYATLINADLDDDDIHTPISAENDSDSSGQDFDLTPSEYAIIKPLFYLYVERENSVALEATQGQGLVMYGRNTDVIAAEIKDLQERMHILAFSRAIETI